MKNSTMWNCIVLHQVNGRIVSRWDFGDELDKAIDFVHDAMDDVYQTGKHLFDVIDEKTGRRFYKQEFEIIG